MMANMLELNMDKTEVSVLMNKSLRNPISINKTKIDPNDISTASNVKNLGVIFDSALSSEAFVNSIFKSAWFNLFNISRSRRSLTTDAAKINFQANVMSKNRLLQQPAVWHPKLTIESYSANSELCCVGGPQAAQNQPYHTSTGHTILAPANHRIDFKIALLVYKALNNQTPAYIADSLQSYDPPWKLSSADKQLLSQLTCRLKSYGDRAVCCAAQLYGTRSLTVWRLPRLLIVFKWN